MSADLALIEANRLACLQPRDTDSFVGDVLLLLNEAKKYQRGDATTAARCKQMYGELSQRTVGRLIFKKSPKHESPKLKLIGLAKSPKGVEKKVEKQLIEKISEIKREDLSPRPYRFDLF